MPTRGYRKGISDTQEPVTAFARTRLPKRVLEQLDVEAVNRSLTRSNLLRLVVEAHVSKRRAQLPQPKAHLAHAIRTLAPIANNLNQLTRQANTGMVSVPEHELRQVLNAVLAAMDRI